MKIGIATIHRSANYGASLQSFALWKFLDMNGFDCQIIDILRPEHEGFKLSRRYKRYPFPIEQTLLWKIKTFIKKYVLRRNVEDKIRPNPWSNACSLKKFNRFNAQIKMTLPYNIDDLYDHPPLFDVYLTGSDQLWNPTQNFCIEPYFLTFAPKGAKKISYAASIAVPKLRKCEQRDFKSWLSEYDTISVRENSAQKLLQSLVDKKIEKVSDPTFLLGIDFWKALAKKNMHSKPYILVFTLSFDKRIIDFAMKLKSDSGMEVLVLDQIQPEPVNDYVPITDAGPEDFLGYINEATMVITNSFHCSLFSIFLGANFFTYIAPENTRGSRIIDLLNTFGLSSRLLNPNLSQTYHVLSKIPPIDKDNVYSIFKIEQKRSQEFLLNSLMP